MNIREVFANNLRRLRHEKGLSQEELARRADVHRTYVSSLERGQYSASIDIVANLALILGVEAADLLMARPKAHVRSVVDTEKE